MKEQIVNFKKKSNVIIGKRQNSQVIKSNISSDENNSINEAIERIDTAIQNMSKTFTDIIENSLRQCNINQENIFKGHLENAFQNIESRIEVKFNELIKKSKEELKIIQENN